jgi:hypothetical protein
MPTALQLASDKEIWTLTNLISLYTSHRTAFYSLWNYLWLVIAASVTASVSLDPQKAPRKFRYFLVGGFILYALGNLWLLLSAQREMQAVFEAIRAKAGVESGTLQLLSVPTWGGVLVAHLVLDALVVWGHVILIRGKAGRATRQAT